MPVDERALKEKIIPSVLGSIREKRWFSGKSKEIVSARPYDWGEWGEAGQFLPLILGIEYAKGEELYFIPLARSGENGHADEYRDALGSDGFTQLLIEGIREERVLDMKSGTVQASAAPGSNEFISSVPPGNHILEGEQSNTSVIIGRRLIYKNIRRIVPGENPDYEIPLRLKKMGTEGITPAPAGILRYRRGGNVFTLGTLFQYVENEGDCWRYIQQFLPRMFQEMRAGSKEANSMKEEFLAILRDLGSITARLHNALSAETSEEAFAPQPLTDERMDEWRRSYSSLLDETLASLRESNRRSGIPTEEEMQAVNAMEGAMKRQGSLPIRMADAEMYLIRIHGDYHLGQVLKSGHKFAIIDFEGEPLRSLEERRKRHCALRDVAGMMRSIDYAVCAAARVVQPPETLNALKREAPLAFLESYMRNYSPGLPYIPASVDMQEKLLHFFIAEKAIYELNYEIDNRPDWIDIPLDALKMLFGEI